MKQAGRIVVDGKMPVQNRNILQQDSSYARMEMLIGHVVGFRAAQGWIILHSVRRDDGRSL
jgi:hypothetical protein